MPFLLGLSVIIAILDRLWHLNPLLGKTVLDLAARAGALARMDQGFLYDSSRHLLALINDVIKPGYAALTA